MYKGNIGSIHGEINEINDRVKAISRNSIQSNEELRDRCFDNVESNIKNILNKHDFLSII